MFNIADLIVMVLVLVSILIGYKRGFIKTGFGLISFFLAIAITFMFYKPVANIIKEKTGFEDWLYEYLYTMNLDEKTEDIEEDAENDFENEASSADIYMENLPDSIIEMLEIDQIKENAKNTIIEKIVEFTVKLFAILIVYIIAKIALAILVWILNLFAKLPVIKEFNQVLGLILGALLGLIRVYSICAIIALISSFSITNSLTAIINSSLFAHTFYDNNLLIKLLF